MSTQLGLDKVLTISIHSRRPSDWRRRLGACLLPPVQERSSRCEHMPSPRFLYILTTERTQYLNAIWEVINFEEAERRFVSKNAGL